MIGAVHCILFVQNQQESAAIYWRSWTERRR
jgi:hypothetical protein